MQQHSILAHSRRETDRRRTLLAAASAVFAGGGALLAAQLGTIWGFLWLLVAVGAAILADRVLWNAIAEPVQQVLEAIERLAAGDSDVRVEPETLGALGHFSGTLNALAERQSQLSREVTTLIERLQEIPDRVFAAMKEVDSGRGATEEAVE